MRTRLSPELRFVAACALATDDVLARRAQELDAAGLDWDRVADLAVENSVLAMMGGRLESAAPGLLPKQIFQAAQADQTRNLALQTAQAHQTSQVCRMLADAGVRSLVLKGVPLSRMLYPYRPEWRYSSDIDLLIDLADLPKLDDLMMASGCERTSPDAKMAAELSPQIISRFSKDFQYLSADKAHHIDLHWRLTRNPHVLSFSFDELLANSVETDAGFGPMRSLDGPILLAFLAWHGIVKPDHALKWVGDVIWMRRGLENLQIDLDPVDWPASRP